MTWDVLRWFVVCSYRSRGDKKSNPRRQKFDNLDGCRFGIQMEADKVRKSPSKEPLKPLQGGPGERHPLFGALKGVTSIPPGVDLTKPADPDWADISEQDSGPPARR